MPISAAAVKSYVERLPPLPLTTTKILRLTEDPKSTPQQIAQAIAVDPTLAAKILKLVNSAYFSLNQEVTQVSKAIILLGMNTVRNVAISSSTMDVLKRQKAAGGIDLDAFWHHSVACGVTAKTVATIKKVDRKLLEDYFIAGLMHDIGVLAMNMLDGRAMKVAHEKARQSGNDVLKLELKYTGTTHAHVGYQMAQHWKLPKPIMAAIAYHHEIRPPDKPHADFSNSIHLANVFCWHKKWGIDRVVDEEGLKPLMDAVGVTFKQIEDRATVIEEGIDKARVFIQT